MPNFLLEPRSLDLARSARSSAAPGLVRARTGRRIGLLALLAAASTAVGQATTEQGTESQQAESGTPVNAPAAPAATARATPVHDALKSADADVALYTQHVMTLSNPFFEGRSADTPGCRMAADYVAAHFEAAGLEPAFAEGASVGDPGDTDPARSPWDQRFYVNGRLEMKLGELSLASGGDITRFTVSEDFSPMGFSASSTVTAPVVCVGYSIVDGPEGYSSYTEGDDLTGKIALLFRFEPMDEQGRSKWGRGGGWSQRAAFDGKVTAALERGAAGIIIVNTPGADDPRTRELDPPAATRFGPESTVPVVMMSPPAASKLVAALDKQGRTLLDLRRLADDLVKPEGSRLIDLSESGATVTLGVELNQPRLATQNVGGILRGKGSLADQWIVIGGHYDHVGYGYLGGSASGDVGQLHPGADDNASGTAGVLLLAKRLSEAYATMHEGAEARSILFLAFAAEEMGLLGSEHFVDHTTLSAGSINAMINLDMIGRLRNGDLEMNGTGTAAEWPEILDPIFASSGLNITRIASGQGPSDHASFYAREMPVLFPFTGLHPEYHRPGDVGPLVNFDGAVQVCDLVEQIAMAVATRPQALTFTRAAAGGEPGRPRFASRVRLGVTPGDYSGERPGVLVTEVAPGTSADRGGIKAGDVIIKWGGEELGDVRSMMQRLGEAEPDDTVEIVVLRDGQEVTLSVTLLAREAP